MKEKIRKEEVKGGSPFMSPNYSLSAQNLFRGHTSSLYVPPTHNTYVPPIYGSQSFNQKSFVAVSVKKKNILIGLVTAGVLLTLGIITAITWYFVSISDCIPCGSAEGCVSPSNWCDGIPQCQNGEDEQCFQLANSSFVLYAKSLTLGWRPVCHDHWNRIHGKQVCKTIGYDSSSYSSYGSALASSVGSSEFMILNESLKTRNTYQKLSFSKNCSSGLVVTLHCIDCGIRIYTRNTSERIVGGQPAVEGEFPWQASLHLNDRHICGGTILTPYWVITAAHCGERHSYPSLWHVYGGFLRQTETLYVNSYNIDKFISHEKFDSKTKDYDIALMKLRTPFKFSETLRPACLPNYGQKFSTASNCWISGWGDTKEGGSPSEILQKALVPLISYRDCKLLYYEIITPRMQCAGFEEGGRDACQGDSGGPLVTNQNSIWWLVGVTSWGYGCARFGKPGVYTKVTTLLDWIYMQFKANISMKLDKFGSTSVVQENIQNIKGHIEISDSSSFRG
ncbi:transmembrane protease serine 2-like [Heterodontus francisci]|uniref:transmembrane protease serine 2-like n=1 Tax=Heterodontus francisci TaxID=7792 RepID=UPI00355BFA66